MTGTQVEAQRAQLHATLHALSQPLTVVSLALTLAQASSSEAERTLALEAAWAECQRAMSSVHQLRSLLNESAKQELVIADISAGTEAQAQWQFGGAA